MTCPQSKNQGASNVMYYNFNCNGAKKLQMTCTVCEAYLKRMIFGHLEDNGSRFNKYLKRGLAWFYIL